MFHRGGQVTLNLQNIVFHHFRVFMFVCVILIVLDFVQPERKVNKKCTIKHSSAGVSMSQNTFVHPGLSSGCHSFIITLS